MLRSRFSVLALLVLGGCRGAGPTVTPEPPMATEPKPEPEAKVPEKPPLPAETIPIELEAERFAFVAYDDGPFPNVAPAQWPRVVVSIDNPEGEDAKLAERLTADDRGWEAHQDPATIGLPPPPTIWMFGAEGACQAKVGPAYVSAYEDAYLTLERGFRIEPCTKTFAPVAFLGPEAPPMRWRVATNEYYETVEPATWDHPVRATLMARGLAQWDADAPPPDEIIVRIRKAGAIAELGYAQHWPNEDDCAEDQAIDQTVGFWDGAAFEPLPSVNEYAGSPELVGVLELDGKPRVAIGDLSFQLQLGVLEGRDVTWTELPTGDYHDEDVAYWGWSVLDGYCGP